MLELVPKLMKFVTCVYVYNQLEYLFVYTLESSTNSTSDYY